jgi:hypothetical protein
MVWQSTLDHAGNAVDPIYLLREPDRAPGTPVPVSPAGGSKGYVEIPAEIVVDGQGVRWVQLPREAVVVNGKVVGGGDLPDRWVRLPESDRAPVVGGGGKQKGVNDGYRWQEYTEEVSGVHVYHGSEKVVPPVPRTGWKLIKPEVKPEPVDHFGGPGRELGSAPGGVSGPGRPLVKSVVDSPLGKLAGDGPRRLGEGSAETSLSEGAAAFLDRRGELGPRAGSAVESVVDRRWGNLVRVGWGGWGRGRERRRCRRAALK